MTPEQLPDINLKCILYLLWAVIRMITSRNLKGVVHIQNYMSLLQNPRKYAGLSYNELSSIGGRGERDIVLHS